MSDEESAESTGGALAGAATGAVLGTNIAIGLAAATGGWGAVVAPQIIVCCAVIGAVKGYDNPKGNVFPAMAAIGMAGGWLGKVKRN